MATRNFARANVGGQNNADYGLNMAFVLEKVLDTSLPAITLRNVNYAAFAQGAGDIAQLIAISAGLLVLSAGAQVGAPAGLACTMDTGDGTTVNQYLAAVNINAASTKAVPTRYGAPVANAKFYTANDLYQARYNSATAASLIRHTLLVLNLDGSLTPPSSSVIPPVTAPDSWKGTYN